MSHAFKNIRDSVSQGDFLTNKKSILTYCDSNSRYNKITTATSYNQLYLYNNTSRRIVSLQRKTLYSKYDLINGQYSKMNLLGVCAAIPSTIKASNLNFWLNIWLMNILVKLLLLMKMVMILKKSNTLF